jgi:hypothetical protein
LFLPGAGEPARRFGLSPSSLPSLTEFIPNQSKPDRASPNAVAGQGEAPAGRRPGKRRHPRKHPRCGTPRNFKTHSQHELSISRKRKTVKGTIRSIRSIREKHPREPGCWEKSTSNHAKYANRDLVSHILRGSRLSPVLGRSPTEN